MPTRLSGEKLAAKLNDLRNRNIMMVSDYNGSTEKYIFECLKKDCSHRWLTGWHSLLSSDSGCPKCAGKFIDDESIQKRIDYLKLRSIKLLSPYEGTSKHHDLECLKAGCHHEWRTRLMKVLCKNKPTGCPKCASNFVDEVSIQKKLDDLESRSIKILSSYMGSTKHHDFQCLKPKCQHIWKATYDSMLNAKKGCPRCAGQCLTEDEKIVNDYRNKIRARISTLYRNGSINISVHRDNEYMTEVLEYCKTQIDKLPIKPDDIQDWHLDHIIPVSKFNHTDIEQVKICWHSKNLQWLPANVNESKKDRLMPEYFTDWHYEVINRLGLEVA